MRQNRNRRGVAMVLVLAVIALGATLGYAMLNRAAMSSQVTRNSENLASADFLAESGINIAAYYIQHPNRAPGWPSYSSNVDWYWTGTGGAVSFSTSGLGTINVTVTRDSGNRWAYEIVSIGKTATGSLSRTVKARAYVNASYQIKYSAIFNGSTTMQQFFVFGQSGSNVGDIYSNSSVNIKSTAKVYGNVYRRASAFGSLNPQAGYSFITLSTTAWPLVAPSSISEIRSYTDYYFNDDGVLDHAGVFNGDQDWDDDDIATLGPEAGNRAGIYIINGNLEIDDDFNITGTLIVKGNLRVRGLNNSITAMSGFPALIVQNNIDYNTNNNIALTVNGVCWADKVQGQSDTIGTLNVNGALLTHGTNGVFNGATGAKLNVKYVASAVDVPDLAEKGRVVDSVKLLRWGD